MPFVDGFNLLSFAVSNLKISKFETKRWFKIRIQVKSPNLHYVSINSMNEVNYPSKLTVIVIVKIPFLFRKVFSNANFGQRVP